MSNLDKDLQILLNNVKSLEKSQQYILDKTEYLYKNIAELNAIVADVLKYITPMQLFHDALKQTNNPNPIVETFPELHNDDENKHLIDDLWTSVRLSNTLKSAGYIYLEDIEFPLDERKLLRSIDNFGMKTLYELNLLLVKHIGKAAFGNKIPSLRYSMHHYDFYLSECRFFKKQVDCLETYIKMTVENKNKEMINDIYVNHLEDVSQMIKALKNYIEVFYLDEEGIKDFFLNNQYLVSYFSKQLIS